MKKYTVHISVFALLLISSPWIYSSTVNAIQDYIQIAAPANPSAGQSRLYFDSTTHQIACLNSDGSSCAPSGLSFSVAAFGATGNGTTNDTTAIQTAINSVASGGQVYFPPGTYLTNKLTVANANVQLWLSDGATLKLAAGTNDDVVLATASGFLMQGGAINGNSTAQTTGTSAGVHINASGTSQSLTNARVVGTEIYATRNQGILFEQTGSGASQTYCSVQSVYIHDIGSAAVAQIAEGVALYAPSKCTITGNRIVNTANHGVVSTRGSDNLIQNNVIVSPGANFNNGFAHCVAVDGNGGSNPNSGHIIDANYCENAHDHGIEVADRVDHVVISNNTVNGTAATGVGGIYFGGGLAFSEYANIVGNHVFSVKGSGIIVEGISAARSAHVTVTGNVVQNSTQNGIYVHFCDEGTVTGNVVMNSSFGSVGSFSGITLTSANRWTINQNESSDNQGTRTQQYGVNITTVPAQFINVLGNLLEPEQTGAINLPGGNNGAVGIRCMNNTGFNPSNTTFTPTVPSSGATVTNNTGTDVMVFVGTNSAGTQILIGGTSGAHNVANLPTATAFAYHLPVGQTAGFVYSGAAPSWQWIGE